MKHLKIIAAVAACLALGACETARGLGALGYCVIHQNNSNKRCT